MAWLFSASSVETMGWRDSCRDWRVSHLGLGRKVCIFIHLSCHAKLHAKLCLKRLLRNKVLPKPPSAKGKEKENSQQQTGGGHPVVIVDESDEETDSGEDEWTSCDDDSAEIEAVTASNLMWDTLIYSQPSPKYPTSTFQYHYEAPTPSSTTPPPPDAAKLQDAVLEAARRRDMVTEERLRANFGRAIHLSPPSSPPIPTPAKDLPTVAEYAPLGFPYNLLIAAIPSTPRTTKQNILRTEMFESIWQSHLWSRYIHKQSVRGPRRKSSPSLPDREPIATINPVVHLTKRTDGRHSGGADAEREAVRRELQRVHLTQNKTYCASWDGIMLDYETSLYATLEDDATDGLLYGGTRSYVV
ncbi:uncharacterized protein EV420DRAFT_1639901 [Desarmillaria tabescens]|uniref:Uncharacterized protein n=1 Tax=Armillaria tabescens TaxID=1929756 RepID=A0AA39N9P6_ARMTA|nr:uncharacterized protein EV420DRAFT_1639901 [Desarmillaria tabescens]KAK0461604.1 hypothetical protein EV420DRAFT_1639901 [Desarmillaria tabescens]